MKGLCRPLWHQIGLPRGDGRLWVGVRLLFPCKLCTPAGSCGNQTSLSPKEQLLAAASSAPVPCHTPDGKGALRGLGQADSSGVAQAQMTGWL